MARVSDPTPVDPEVASALLRTHLGDFFAGSHHVAGTPGWEFALTDDQVVAIVTIPARHLEEHQHATYTVRLDATYYDTWPVAATFVRETEDGWVRARLGTTEFPFICGSPGAPSLPDVSPPFEFALHDDYAFPGDVHDQLICFSYSFGYYLSGHNPAENQKWRPGSDRLDATLNRLFTVLNSPAYVGPSKEAGAA